MSLSRIRVGEREAFERLVNDTWDDLVEHLTWLLGSREAAEDAGQEVFTRIWEHREGWRDGSARGLVFRIGRNLALDVLRREQVWRDSVVRKEQIVPPVESADNLAETTECERRFFAALAALAPNRREVIELVKLRGLTHGEVAEVLGVAKQTVSNRITLALVDLRVLLADLLPTPQEEGRPTPDRETIDG